MKLKAKIVYVALTGVCYHSAAQEINRGSIAGESAMRRMKENRREYNLRFKDWRFTAEALLALEYNNNIFRSAKSEQDDYIFRPEVTLHAHYPLTELNTLDLSLGIGYNLFTRNTELNSSGPLISPDSDIAFTMFIKDFRIRLHDAFSYQESLFYNSLVSEGQFYNFDNVGKLSRFQNFVGPTVDWDLNKVLITASYDHETFYSSSSRFDYLNRESEWITAKASYSLNPNIRVGLENEFSLHNYTESDNLLKDHLRYRVGPFSSVDLTSNISFQVGAGWELAEFNEAFAESDASRYYAYGQLRHRINQWMSHFLRVGRQNALGQNANNFSTVYARYTASWQINEYWNSAIRAGVDDATEFGGPYYEDFKYYRAGISLGYQFHKHWTASASYDFYRKNSELIDRDYDQSAVTVGARFTF